MILIRGGLRAGRDIRVRLQRQNSLTMAMFRAFKRKVEHGLIVPLPCTANFSAMSDPMSIPNRQPPAEPHDMSPASPPFGKSPRTHFLLPSPVPCRRTRTQSVSERAMAGPSFSGTIMNFCRNKGHGFVKPDDGSDLLFVHISDIDEEYVLQDGDRVEYKTVLIPPKNEKKQAVHVRITNPVKGVKHERWDEPVLHGTPH